MGGHELHCWADTALRVGGRSIHCWADVQGIHCWAEALEAETGVLWRETEVLMRGVKRIVELAEVSGRIAGALKH